ncbi:uncharacterized protein [Anabrus simplex]|uniref:uncharacterized protein n=1 Tax=Anabrus simplex TaxID=316456 RepID=UPI0035A2D907
MSFVLSTRNIRLCVMRDGLVHSRNIKLQLWIWSYFLALNNNCCCQELFSQLPAELTWNLQIGEVLILRSAVFPHLSTEWTWNLQIYEVLKLWKVRDS